MNQSRTQGYSKSGQLPRNEFDESLRYLKDSLFGAPFLNHGNFRICRPNPCSDENVHVNELERKCLGFNISNKTPIFNQELFYSSASGEIPTTGESDRNMLSEATETSTESTFANLCKAYISNPESSRYIKGTDESCSAKKNPTIPDRNLTSPEPENKVFIEHVQRMLNFGIFESVLPYTIHSWSSFSANYYPHNIIPNNPSEQESRWSSNANNQMQYIILKLDNPSLVRSIKFGKFYKSHVCNLREFKVYAGMSPDKMVEILHSGVRNDDKEEIITTSQLIQGHFIPTQYLAVQPLVAYDQKFNFSIWHIQLFGTADPSIMGRIMIDFQKVENANFSMVESIIMKASDEGYLGSGAKEMPYYCDWRRVDVKAYNSEPKGRGGHQLCIDDIRLKLYLFGGWDGQKNLSDLWEYDILTQKWTCLCYESAKFGGPDSRSLHSMCFDSVKNCLYIMGKYVDQEERDSTTNENELYCYRISSKKWKLLSPDTYREGGPRLMHDSKMVFDHVKQYVYVYGGKLMNSHYQDIGTVFGGLYCYHTRFNKWKMLRPDARISDHEFQLQGRMYHSLAIDPDSQRLFIVSGQKDSKNLGDLYIYDILSDTFFERTKDLAMKSLPKVKSSYEQRDYPVYQASAAEAQFSTKNHKNKNEFFDDYINLETKNNESAILKWYSKNGYCITNKLRSIAEVSNSKKSQFFSQSDSGSLSEGEYPINQNNAKNIRTVRASFDSSTKELHIVSGYFYNLSAYNQPISSYGLKRALDEFETSSSSNHSYILDASYGFQRDVKHPFSKSGAEACLLDKRLTSNPYTENIGMSVLTYKTSIDEWEENYNSALDISHRSNVEKKTYTSKSSTHSVAEETTLTIKKKRPYDHNTISADKFFTKLGPCVQTDFEMVEEFSNGASSSGKTHPLPRYAMEIVYSQKTSTHYMFGGNSNNLNYSKTRKPTKDQEYNGFPEDERLGDLWAMKLKKPSPSAILRKCLYLIRTQKYIHMCLTTLNHISSLKTTANSSISISDKPGFNHQAPFPISSLHKWNEAIGNTRKEPLEVANGKNLKSGMAMCLDLKNPNELEGETPSVDLDNLNSAETETNATLACLSYLKQHISVLVNFNDTLESNRYKKLVQMLYLTQSEFYGFVKAEFDLEFSASPTLISKNFIWEAMNQAQATPDERPNSIMKKARLDLYNKLLEFFPRSERQSGSELESVGFNYKSF